MRPTPFAPPLLVLCLLVVGCGGRPDGGEVVIEDGMAREQVEALLRSRGARDIAPLAGRLKRRTNGWWLLPGDLALRLDFDRRGDLVSITKGLPGRGFRSADDWQRQKKSVVRQLILE